MPATRYLRKADSIEGPYLVQNLFKDHGPRPGGGNADGGCAGGEIAANASLGLVARASGGEAHDRPYRNIRRLAAKAAYTSEKGTLVKLVTDEHQTTSQHPSYSPPQ
jgi:hypothetical protein